MESSASVSKGNDQSRKGSCSRRSWTVQEEMVLINSLKESVVNGWKADNGFKSGYQAILETAMIKAFPNTDLRATPHINSKIHVWKKDYGSLSTMMRTSGFGWNEDTNMITVEKDEQWNDYVKTNGNAKGMRYKAWPYFKHWREIFGKDRATGENSQTFHEVIQEVLVPPSQQQRPREKTPEMADPSTQPDTTSTFHPGNCSSERSKNKKKKRVRDDDVDGRFIDLFASFCEKTDARLGDLANRLGDELDTVSARKAINDALQKMNFLTTEDKIAVGTKLCTKTKELDYFFTLNDEDKAVMVKMILEGQL